MQTKFSQNAKIFFRAGSEEPPNFPAFSKITKKPAAEPFQRYIPRSHRLPSVRQNTPPEDPRRRSQRRKKARPRLPPAGKPHRPAPDAGSGADAGSRKIVPVPPPAPGRTAAGRAPFPASSEQPAPPTAALPGFLIGQGGNVPVHRYLPALQREGFQLQLPSLDDEGPQ